MKRIYLPGIVFFSDLFASGLPSARSVLCPGSMPLMLSVLCPGCVLPERPQPSSLRSAAHATADSVPATIPPERPCPSSRGMRSGTPLPGLSFPSFRPPRQPPVAGVPPFAPGPFRSHGRGRPCRPHAPGLQPRELFLSADERGCYKSLLRHVTTRRQQGTRRAFASLHSADIQVFTL